MSRMHFQIMSLLDSLQFLAGHLRSPHFSLCNPHSVMCGRIGAEEIVWYHWIPQKCASQNARYHWMYPVQSKMFEFLIGSAPSPQGFLSSLEFLLVAAMLALLSCSPCVSQTSSKAGCVACSALHLTGACVVVVCRLRRRSGRH